MVSAVEGLSPRSRARLAGVFEVFEGVTGVIGQNIVPGMVLVGRDATATANNPVNSTAAPTTFKSSVP